MTLSFKSDCEAGNFSDADSDEMRFDRTDKKVQFWSHSTETKAENAILHAYRIESVQPLYL